MGAVASKITSLTTVQSTIYSDADERKHQISASLAFVWGIHRWPVNSPHKWPATRKMFPFWWRHHDSEMNAKEHLWWWAGIDAGNGVVANRRQAIICIIVDQVLWRDITQLVYNFVGMSLTIHTGYGPNSSAIDTLGVWLWAGSLEWFANCKWSPLAARCDFEGHHCFCRRPGSYWC